MKPLPVNVNAAFSPVRPVMPVSTGTICSRTPALRVVPVCTRTLPVVARSGTSTCRRVPASLMASGVARNSPAEPSMVRVANSTRVAASKLVPLSVTSWPTLADATAACAAVPSVASAVMLASVAGCTATAAASVTWCTVPCVVDTRSVPSAMNARPEISPLLMPWLARSFSNAGLEAV